MPPARSTSRHHAVVLEAYDKAFTNFRKDLVETLVRAGWKVSAVAPSFSADVKGHLGDLGVEFHPLEFSRGSIDPRKELRAIRRLSALLEELKPSVVFAFGPKPVIYSGLATTSFPLMRTGVVTGLGFGFTAGGAKAMLVQASQRWLYRRALRRTNVVLFQNEDDRLLFEKQGLLRRNRKGVGVVNGSGVDLEKFAHSPLESSASNKQTFLFVGRLQSSKGFEAFAGAAEIVKRSNVNVEFRVVGWRDSQNPETVAQSYLQRLEDEGVLTYVGRVDDVRSELEGCTVLALPSIREGTPRSVLEALSVGRAVITTDVPGCRETVVDGWNGFLVAPRSPYQIASAMLKYSLDGSLAATHGNRGRRLAEMKYDVHEVNASILTKSGLSLNSGVEGIPMEALLPPRTSSHYGVDEIDHVVRLHLESFPGFFMSSLGDRFLKLFYLGFVEDPDAVVSVARNDKGELVGVAVGTVRPRGFFRRLLLRRLGRFAIASAGAAVRRPAIVGRLLRGILYRGDSPSAVQGALLSSIAVSPSVQGTGVGTRLLLNWEACAKLKGAEFAYLTTDATSNDGVNRFYKSSGWNLLDTYVTREGRDMNRYIRTL